MSTLIIRRDIESFPIFGLYKWRYPDYEVPLKIPVQNATASFYLPRERFSTSSRLHIFTKVRFQLEFTPASRDLVRSMSSSGGRALEVAEQIYTCYTEAITKFEALLMSTGRVRNLHTTRTISIYEFFESFSILQEAVVEWSLDGGDFQPFSPKIPKRHGRTPLFKVDQLITPTKWSKLQEAAYQGDFPKDEVLELLRIRSKATKWNKKIPIIEAAIIAESLLRLYGLEVLRENGFSGKKIKSLNSEFSFNNLLNIVLPLSLTKSELKRMQTSINAVDVLRRIRNDLVHGNIQAEEVDIDNMLRGIDAALRLAEFLRKKAKKT